MDQKKHEIKQVDESSLENSSVLFSGVVSFKNREGIKEKIFFYFVILQN